MKKVLVLGGTGFHGKEVIRLAKERGYDVHSLSLEEGTDLRNLAAVTAKFKELAPDAIIVCAGHEGTLPYLAKNGGDVLHDNLMIVANTYRAAALAFPGAKIINALGNCSYPGEVDLQSEATWQSGPVHESVLPSGIVKRITHALADSYKKQYGISTVNWLVSNSYGPGGSLDVHKLHALNGIIVRMITAQRNGDTTFEIWGSGKPIREWTYVTDAARILVDSLQMPEQIYPINFAHGQGHTVNEIATLAAKALDYNVTFTYNTSKPDGAAIKVLDDKLFRSKYPDFKFTPLAEGIKNTVEYYKTIV